ncbi:MAG: Gfo/Idh/MocA family oxidoreductase [Candidatus Pacebacteria bacterium]|nr:Gfo/Idh/MocA family oxidoreductase [Candidatus Paceibacterota bacterium]
MKQINVAVLGLGGMGGTHVGAAKASPYVNKIIGYEPDPERARLRGEELGIESTADLDAILNDPDIALVTIAAINAVHAEQTIRSLRAGKAVLCEKPMAENLADAKNMVAAEAETGIFLQIGFELHYSKMYTTVKDWIDAGLIGTPVNCHCRYYCSEFHLKNTWRSRSKGTMIGEKLSHYLDLQRWFMGSPVEDVFSMHAPNAVTYFNHPDNHQINLRFENDAIANLNFVMHIGETDHTDPLLELLEKQSDDGHFLQYHIFGTKGAIEADVFRRRIRRWEFSDSPKQLVSKIVETLTFPKEEDQVWFHNTHGQNVRVAELVAKGLPPENPATDALETMKVGFAAETSEREKRIVKLSEM